MQILLTKWLARFVRQERIADSNLREAIERANQGLIDADLGGGLIKQRVARKGKGRSGGYRTVLAYRVGISAVFLYTFAKNERDNVDHAELIELRQLGRNWLNATQTRLLKRLRKELYRRSMMTTQKLSKPLSEAILETANDQHRLGVMVDAAYRKITVRHLGTQRLETAQPISGPEIRVIRENAQLSQAAFARYLNLTVGYISQLERGTKHPKGPALTLLNVMRRKGFDVVL